MVGLPYPPVKTNATALIEPTPTFDVEKGTYVHGTGTTYNVFYNEHRKWIQDESGKRIESAGTVYVFEDIFSGSTSAANMTGFITINGNRYTFSASRFYNPGGSVHHVRLELR